CICFYFSSTYLSGLTPTLSSLFPYTTLFRSIVLAALFFGALSSGGAMIQLFSDIPLDLINILQGTVMIFAVIELSRLPLVKRWLDRKSTRLNSSHRTISYAVFCLK